MRNTIILVLFAAILGAYVWFYEIEGEEERQAQQELEDKLVTIPKDSIKTIIINDFDTTFEFEKNKDGWVITRPVMTGADESAVSSLLSSLTNAKKSRTFAADPVQKAQYGLNNPMIRLKVIAFDGTADSLQMGIKTSIDENMYVSRSVQDSIVAITPISLKNNAQKHCSAGGIKKHCILTKIRYALLISRAVMRNILSSKKDRIGKSLNRWKMKQITVQLMLS